MNPIRNHSGRTQLLPQMFFCMVVLLSLAIPGITSTTVLAQSWYIKPSAEIPVRRGQGTEFRILVVLENGTQVSILEENDPWAKIQTQNGTKGWILKRYLTEQPPLDIVVEELRTQNSVLQEKKETLSQRLSSTTINKNELQSELSSCMTALNKTRDDFRFLEEETADVVAIKTNLTQSEKKVEELSTKLEEVIQENDYLKKSQQTRWFLAGVATLVFGWLVGHLSAKSRKRRSTLY